MKTQLKLAALALLLSTIHSPLLTCLAQGTAFTYQGQLKAGGNPVNGSYDLTFSLFTDSGGVNQTGLTLTNSGTPVSNGLFTVTLDFGPGFFDGTALWLQIGVETNGGGGFTLLSPLQQVTPAPYALHAENAFMANNAATAGNATLAYGVVSGAVTGAGIASGSVVKSLNSLKDAVTLSPGANISITPSGNTLTIAATGGGGNAWSLFGNAGTSPDIGYFVGTTDNEPLELRVFGRRLLRLEPGTSNVIGGFACIANGPNATVAGGVGNQAYGTGSFVGGGGFDGSAYSPNIANGAASSIGGGAGNQASGSYAAVGGGLFNTAGGVGTVGGGTGNVTASLFATVAGGVNNHATGFGSFIGGGGVDGYGDTFMNTASGGGSVIAGGVTNQAGGLNAAIPGGSNNVANGVASFAAGANASANDDYSFVWGDGSRAAVSQGANSFTALATGGVWFFTGPFPDGIKLPPNGSAWVTLSDRNYKKNIAPVDYQTVLDRLAKVPISQWNYQWEKDSDTPNIGPMAQDFKAAFYPGRDDKGISTLEFDGVELAAIQGLNEKLEDRSQKSEVQIEELKAENAELKARLEKLEQLINRKHGDDK
jgi:hypothetical protein